jgi:hypothetical protein
MPNLTCNPWKQVIEFDNKVGIKYVWNWLVNKVFKPTFSLNFLKKYICTKLGCKIIVYSNISFKFYFLFIRA